MHEWFTHARALDRWSFTVTMQICALMQNLERELNRLSCELEALWFIWINILYKTVSNVGFASIISSPEHGRRICANTIVSFPLWNMKISRRLFCTYILPKVTLSNNLCHSNISRSGIWDSVDVWLHASTFSTKTKIYFFHFSFSFFLLQYLFLTKQSDAFLSGVHLYA